jgi:rSAM/selenodomain-associated transferase 1
VDVALLVIAKAPVPGRVKTRLCPPLTGEQAAALAGAALLDTLETVARTPASRRVLVFDDGGDPETIERWAPPGFELIAQRGAGLAERLAAAFSDAGGPSLLVGMDTPQLTTELLLDGVRALSTPGVDAVLGPALDGGYWSVGLREPHAEVFAGVPMSVAGTCSAQRRVMRSLGLRLHEQASLRDVDTIADARLVAAQVPGSRFTAALGAVDQAESVAA